MSNELEGILDDMAKKRDFKKDKLEKALEVEIEKIIGGEI